MINIKMPDEKFDLMSVSDKELFFALKPEIIKIIKRFKNFNYVEDKDIVLNEQYSNRRKTFGKDSNLYPHIVLDIAVKSYLQYEHFDLFIDTFSVKIAPHKYNPEIIEDNSLTSAFINFMITKFPKSNYLYKRNEYYKQADIKNRLNSKLI